MAELLTKIKNAYEQYVWKLNNSYSSPEKGEQEIKVFRNIEENLNSQNEKLALEK